MGFEHVSRLRGEDHHGAALAREGKEVAEQLGGGDQVEVEDQVRAGLAAGHAGGVDEGTEAAAGFDARAQRRAHGRVGQVAGEGLDLGSARFERLRARFESRRL
ncbi:MAG: hypothetical protein CL931_02140 [Deltaproteobacteria bacterium]|nr:hypothetical protein [Deltaproteobacteria bacterium]